MLVPGIRALSWSEGHLLSKACRVLSFSFQSQCTLGGHSDDFGKTHLIVVLHLILRALQILDAVLNKIHPSMVIHIDSTELINCIQLHYIIINGWPICTLAQTCANLEEKPLIYCWAIRWRSSYHKLSNVSNCSGFRSVCTILKMRKSCVSIKMNKPPPSLTSICRWTKCIQMHWKTGETNKLRIHSRHDSAAHSCLVLFWGPFIFIGRWTKSIPTS